MISYKELLNGHTVIDLTIAQQHNLEDLQKRVNVIRAAWGKPMMVTSGFRTYQDQMRINPKAKKSAHMEAKAVDIRDTDGSLYKFLKEDYEKNGENSLLVVNGLYMEAGTVGWVHLQSRPTRNRIFQP